MTPAELRERISRSRDTASDQHVVDPYVRALAELAALVEERVLAHDALMAAMLSGGDTSEARRRVLEVDWPLRFALGMPARRRKQTGQTRGPGAYYVAAIAVVAGAVD